MCAFWRLPSFLLLLFLSQCEDLDDILFKSKRRFWLPQVKPIFVFVVSNRWHKCFSLWSLQKPSQQVTNPEDEDMFSIPCSQNPPAPRFSSQRSIMQRTQSILASHRQPKNYFESCLMKCGVGLESECYVLSKFDWHFLIQLSEINRNCFSLQSLELCEQS